MFSLESIARMNSFAARMDKRFPVDHAAAELRAMTKLLKGPTRFPKNLGTVTRRTKTQKPKAQ